MFEVTIVQFNKVDHEFKIFFDVYIGLMILLDIKRYSKNYSL